MSKKKQIMQSLISNMDKTNKSEIIILDRFKYLIPPLSEEEFNFLEASILKEGCREPLVAWEKSTSELVLIDGHNRYEICKKHKIDYEIDLREFESEEEVEKWVFENQMGRRNLTLLQISYVRGRRYETEKTKLKFKGNQYQSSLAQLDSTAASLAKEYCVTEKTIKRDALFYLGIEWLGEQNRTVKHEILRGRVSVTKTQIQNLAQMKEEAPFFENVEAFISFLKSSKKDKAKEGQDLLTQEGKSIVEEFGSLLSLIPDSISKTDKQTLKKNLLALIKKML